MALIELHGISRLYETGGETVAALNGVDLSIEAGELVMLLGPSGSGKTTLLNVISALDSPTEGIYRFDGKPVPTSQVEAMAKFRRENVGYIFQFFNLLSDLTALENVMLVQEISGKRDKAAAIQALNSVGLEGLDKRFPSELSGGQQQRVAIARSLVKQPRLLLGDEPTGNLDSDTSAQVMIVLADACRRQGVTALVVTHDIALTKYATRVLKIDSGKIISDEVGGGGTMRSKATNAARDVAQDVAQVTGEAVSKVKQVIDVVGAALSADE